MTKTENELLAEVVADAWDDLVNVDDRTSPEEYPDMCLITRDELAEFMGRALHTEQPASPASEAGEGIVAGLRAALMGSEEAGDQWTFAGMQDAFFRWPVVERELRKVLSRPSSESDTRVALLREAREALEPFAAVSSEGLVGGPGEKGYVTVCTQADYFHRAAAALAKLEQGGAGDAE